MSPIVAEELQTPGHLRRDPGGLVITHTGQQRDGGGAAEIRAMRIFERVKAVLSL